MVEEENISPDAIVVLKIPYEVWKDFVDVCSLAAETQDNKSRAVECVSWLKDAVQNYDGYPVEYFSNGNTVVSAKTGNIIYLT